jgi:hypothetical protein
MTPYQGAPPAHIEKSDPSKLPRPKMKQKRRSSDDLMEEAENLASTN